MELLFPFGCYSGWSFVSDSFFGTAAKAKERSVPHSQYKKKDVGGNIDNKRVNFVLHSWSRPPRATLLLLDGNPSRNLLRIELHLGEVQESTHI